MIVRCQINFMVTQADGSWCVPWDIVTRLDTRRPLLEQAQRHMRREVAQRQRWFGDDIADPVLLSVFINDAGWWHAVHPTDGDGGGVAWPTSLNSVPGRGAT